MFDYLLSVLLITFCCILGNIIGNILFAYITTKKLKKSIFSNKDFEDYDIDFYSNDSSKSITDIDSTDSIDKF